MTRAKIKYGPNGEVLVERFSWIRRLEHWSVAIGFILLVLTGFPQKFDSSAFGHWLITLFGGLDQTRFIHRVVGLVFVGQGAAHVLAIVAGGLTKRMRMTMMPTTQDFRDARAMLRYYIGNQPKKPPLPKFDYRQKFEYMGMILGGIVMIVSGLALMYPGWVVRMLPGQLILAAKVLHSSEAMLAFCVLIIWHVYGTFLNPEVFPLDKTMFTGYMSADELKHHHAREYAYVFGDDEPPDDPSPDAHSGREPSSALREAPDGPPSAPVL
jgi:formate dehydrogenase subunit gamma